MPVISLLGRQKQESQGFKASLNYVEISETRLGYVRPYLKRLNNATGSRIFSNKRIGFHVLFYMVLNIVRIILVA